MLRSSILDLEQLGGQHPIVLSKNHFTCCAVQPGGEVQKQEGENSYFSDDVVERRSSVIPTEITFTGLRLAVDRTSGLSVD